MSLFIPPPALSCAFLSQCEEEDVSHHAHPIWEDPPLLQRSCECLSVSMATHDSPSPSVPHTPSVESSPSLDASCSCQGIFTVSCSIKPRHHISHSANRKIKVVQIVCVSHEGTCQFHSQTANHIFPAVLVIGQHVALRSASSANKMNSFCQSDQSIGFGLNAQNGYEVLCFCLNKAWCLHLGGFN